MFTAKGLFLPLTLLFSLVLRISFEHPFWMPGPSPLVSRFAGNLQGTEPRYLGIFPLSLVYSMDSSKVMRYHAQPRSGFSGIVDVECTGLE
jgi:hypothetical protein